MIFNPKHKIIKIIAAIVCVCFLWQNAVWAADATGKSVAQAVGNTGYVSVLLGVLVIRMAMFGKFIQRKQKQPHYTDTNKGNLKIIHRMNVARCIHFVKPKFWGNYTILVTAIL